MVFLFGRFFEGRYLVDWNDLENFGTDLSADSRTISTINKLSCPNTKFIFICKVINKFVGY